MAITDCCKDCPNKGCGAYHDRCEKYQSELARYRGYIKAEKRINKIKSDLFEINQKGRQARIRKASV